MRRIVICGVACALFIIPQTSAAQHPSADGPFPRPLEARADGAIAGTVLASKARWTANGTRIITESVVSAADGRRVLVRQPGGSVGGIGMRVIPSSPPLRPGDHVTATMKHGWIVGADVMRALPRRATDSEDSTMEFVRTTNSVGAQLYWASGCVHITYDIAGTTHIAGTREFEVMDAVFQHWRSESQSCSYLAFEFDDPDTVEAKFDGTNVVLFRENAWCRPATDDMPEECHSPNAAGLTTLFFIEDESSDRNGEILDADIELNAVNFAFSADGSTTSPLNCKSDLANTFTHEVGHLMGLDHTCWDGRGTAPSDQNGSPVPTCNSAALSDEAREATMYAFQECGETKKGTLEQDDISGVCAMYPVADDPKQCKRADVGGGGCCSISGGDGVPPLGTLLLMALVATAVGRRQRSR